MRFERENMIEDTNGSYRHILKYTGIFGGVQGLNVLIGLVRTKLVAILLGPSGMGLASLFNTTVGFVSQATNLGLPISAVRQMSELYDRGDQEAINHFVKVIRGWSLLTALVGMLVCVAIGPFLSQTTFAWGDHSLHFMLLSPAVGMMAITGGETAILKGMRKLGSIAIIQVLAVVAALAISAPVYYVFGESGIVPVIVMMAFATMVLTLKQSLKLIPLRLRGAKGMLGEGMEMVRLGVAFTLAAVIGTASEMLIRSYLNVTGDLDILGLYNAGYMMTMVYAGMVFSAMETDFFPRLSGIKGTGPELNDVVNKQIEVCLLLISPMLVAFLVALPILLPLLYTGKFMPALGMMQITVLAMYMRAIKLPISYLPLAKGDSGVYLLMEGIYDVVVVVLVILAYQYYGLTGTGAALAIASVFDFLMLYVCMHYVYHYDLSVNILRYSMLQIPIGILAYLLTFFNYGWTYWTLGIVLSVISFFISIKILHSKTRLWATLKKKIKRKR